jgi:hypothetical protein
MRLIRYIAGLKIDNSVNGPPHLKTTFSYCINISTDTVDVIAAARHSQVSTMVGNTVFQLMRCSAPKDAPKRHVMGQILEW